MVPRLSRSLDGFQCVEFLSPRPETWVGQSEESEDQNQGHDRKGSRDQRVLPEPVWSAVLLRRTVLEKGVTSAKVR